MKLPELDKIRIEVSIGYESYIMPFEVGTTLMRCLAKAECWETNYGKETVLKSVDYSKVSFKLISNLEYEEARKMALLEADK